MSSPEGNSDLLSRATFSNKLSASSYLSVITKKRGDSGIHCNQTGVIKKLRLLYWKSFVFHLIFLNIRSTKPNHNCKNIENDLHVTNSNYLKLILRNLDLCNKL